MSVVRFRPWPPININHERNKIKSGCGDKLLEGYINVDLVEDRSGVKPDVNCDLRNLSVFESDYADEILSVHVVEHFWRWEVEQVLSSGFEF